MEMVQAATAQRIKTAIHQERLTVKNSHLGKMYFATTKAHKVYSEVDYEPDCYLMFGKESAGIPEEILVENEDHCVRIPMWGEIRSLNLSNSVAVVLYEALRHNDFEKMALEGQLHHMKWKDGWEQK